jgi:ADP-ribose pyrophosphatase
MTKVSTDWKTLSEKTVLKTPFMEVSEDEIVQPDGRKTTYYYLHKEPFSIIIPLDENKKFIMVRQFRYTVKTISLEFPMGSAGKKDPLEVARIELSEEVGVKAERLTQIGHYWTAVGHTDQDAFVFIAEGLTYGESHPEAGEFFDVERYTFDEIKELINTSKIKDAHTIVAFHYLEGYLKDK